MGSSEESLTGEDCLTHIRSYIRKGVYADEAGDAFNIAIMFMRWCDDDTLPDPLDNLIFAHSHAIWCVFLVYTIRK